MPQVARLSLHHFRHFREHDFLFSNGINLIVGHNGSGKTSILEALFFLAYGKSFRAKELNRMIQQEEREFTLYAEILTPSESNPIQIGMRRSNQESINRWNGETVRNVTPFAEALPLILLCPDSFQLLTGGAKYRRALLDWGVFYHYPERRRDYAVFKKALLQRNQALKKNLPRAEIAIWEHACQAECERIDQARARYFEKLKPILFNLLGEAFYSKQDFQWEYDRGWKANESLEATWHNTFAQDLRFGYTHAGPHQADLKWTAHHQPAKDRLSRGQQKRLISLLKLAQGILLETERACSPIYLLDDLPSELDPSHQEEIMTRLTGYTGQILMTSIQENLPFPHPSSLISLD